MKVLAKSPMTFVMLAIFVVMVGIATTYPEGARFMPFVVGIPAILNVLNLGRVAQIEVTGGLLASGQQPPPVSVAQVIFTRGHPARLSPHFKV